MTLKSETKATFTRKDVAKHNEDGDIWLIIEDSVYDVSKWIYKHPGGYKQMKCMAGKDCTEVFKTFHNERLARTMLPAFCIGKITDAAKGGEVEKSAIAEDLENLRKSLKEEGAFDPDYYFYLKKGLFNALILAIALALVKYSNGYLAMAVASGFFLGLFWQQMAFIGHDIGHHSVTQQTKKDDFYGIMIGNLLTGISIGWWKDSHNYHHIVTNSYNYDPDIQHLPVFAVSKRFFKSFFSEYHQKEFKFDWLAKQFVRNQHYLFYPVMAVARINLYLQSFIFILLRKGVQRRFMELFCCSVFWMWYLALCSCFPTWSERILFFLTAHAVAGLIHIQICLSHFSMEIFDGLPQESHTSDGYVKAQFEATTNIKCPPMMDFFHGGLQFQTEHHLFPRASRNRLRGLQKQVKEFCKKNQIPYHEMSFFEANVAVLKTLKETAEKASNLSPFFVDGLNAVG